MLERRRKFIINLLYFTLIGVIVYALLRFAAYALMPFVIGFAAAAAVNPVLRFLSKRFDMRRRPAGIMLLLLFYATIGMLVTVLSVRAAVALGELSGSLPELYADHIEPLITRFFELIDGFAERVDHVLSKSAPGGMGNENLYDLGRFFAQIKSSLAQAVSELSVQALTRLSGFAAAIPGVAVNIVFAVISSFFFTVEFERIIALVKRFLPEKPAALLRELRSGSASAILRYIRSYFLIMLITFAQLALGLLLIGVESPFKCAFFIALLDILPLIGTGGILLPWAALRFLSGQTASAIGLVVLWGVISLVRNVIEPKIVGTQVGLHPLAALISMFVGTKLFGLAGLFGLPIALAVVLPLVRKRIGERAAHGSRETSLE